MKTAIRCAVFSLLASLTLAACSGDNTPPGIISLPVGFQPEGIAARDNFIYVGSIPTGAVYRADITTGNGSVLVPSQAGRAAIGLKVDGRGRIFVAGGATGKAFVYDAATGQDLATYTLTQVNPTFVNDVVLTDDAAWFTDSRNPVLYRVPIPADGSLAGQQEVTTLTLSGDFLSQFVATVNNLNGIASLGQVAISDINGVITLGPLLVVVQSNTGFLYTVDPTGVTSKIDLGAETVVNGDGLLLEGRTLFVLQNRLNQVAVVDLAAGRASTGTVRTRITNPVGGVAIFDVPTTLTAAGTGLYAVNARFGVPAPAEANYTVVRFDRP